MSTLPVSRHLIYRGRGKSALVVEKRRIDGPAPEPAAHVRQVPERLQRVGAIAAEVAKHRMSGRVSFPRDWQAGTA